MSIIEKKEFELHNTKLFFDLAFPNQVFSFKEGIEPIDILVTNNENNTISVEVSRIETHQNGYETIGIINTLNERIRKELNKVCSYNIFVSIAYKDNIHKINKERHTIPTQIVEELLPYIEKGNFNFEIEESIDNCKNPIFNYIDYLSVYPLGDIETSNRVGYTGAYWSGELPVEIVRTKIESKNRRVNTYKEKSPNSEFLLLLIVEGNQASNITDWNNIENSTFDCNFDHVFIYHRLDNRCIKLNICKTIN